MVSLIIHGRGPACHGQVRGCDIFSVNVRDFTAGKGYTDDKDGRGRHGIRL